MQTTIIMHGDSKMPAKPHCTLIDMDRKTDAVNIRRFVCTTYDCWWGRSQRNPPKNDSLFSPMIISISALCACGLACHAKLCNFDNPLESKVLQYWYCTIVAIHPSHNLNSLSPLRTLKSVLGECHHPLYFLCKTWQELIEL